MQKLRETPSVAKTPKYDIRMFVADEELLPEIEEEECPLPQPAEDSEDSLPSTILRSEESPLSERGAEENAGNVKASAAAVTVGTASRSGEPRFEYRRDGCWSKSSSSGPRRGSSRGRAIGTKTSTTRIPQRGDFSKIRQNVYSSRQMQTPCLRRNRMPRNPRTASSGLVSSRTTTPRPIVCCNIIALVEGRGTAKGEIGLACLDLRNPTLILLQFADTQSYVRVLTQLNILYPTEILMSSNAYDSGGRSKLFQLVSEHFPDANTVAVQRKYFNDSRGMQYIRDLCVAEYKTVEIEVLYKNCCLAACAALIKYVEYIQNVIYAPGSLKIEFRGIANTVMIDTSTANRLELVTNALNRNSNHTLYGVLRHTQTPGGNRLLRASILQPPSDIHTIDTRLGCVSELVDNEDLFYRLKSVIGRFVDTEQLLALCVQLPKEETIRTAEQKISNVVCLKHTLDLVEPLRTVLESSQNPLFKAYCQNLHDPRFGEMLEKIGIVIHSEAYVQKGALNKRMQKCFAVKPNINGLLDIARRTYSEIVDDIANMVKQLAEQHNLPLRIGYTVVRGFFIQIPCNMTSRRIPPVLPEEFVKIVKLKTVITCTTEDMIKMNDRIKESLNEIYLMSNIVITELLKEIRERIGCLHQLTEAVSTLDFLVSLAHTCTLTESVRPQFSDTLAIKSGRHPILEKASSVAVVPNNVFASDENNFIIITGPNMSGKTTYLTQVVLLQIMAHIGSYVPAEFATFRLVDQIFSRIGTKDSIENNFSAFILEMKEANYIVQNVTEKSLVIIDELGKGTSIEDGISIAFSISEEILHTKAFTFCATHLMELTELEAIYSNAANYHLVVEYLLSDDSNSFTTDNTYILKRGRCQDAHYALKMAEITALPVPLVHEAREMLNQYDEQDDVLQTSACKKRKETMQLLTHLLQVARNSELYEDRLGDHLKTLQEQFKSSVITVDKEASDIEDPPDE